MRRCSVLSQLITRHWWELPRAGSHESAMGSRRRSMGCKPRLWSTASRAWSPCRARPGPRHRFRFPPCGRARANTTWHFVWPTIRYRPTTSLGSRRRADHLDLVLVDGEPSSDPLMGEVDFLGVALLAGQEDADAWRVDVRNDVDWGAAPIGQPDLLVLANVASLSATRVKELEQLVRRGMGLMIFLGDQVDTDNYNRLLFRNGDGLLPAAPRYRDRRRDQRAGSRGSGRFALSGIVAIEACRTGKNTIP